MRTGEHLAPPTTAERVRVCRKHLDFSIRWKGDRTGIVEMRRHYASYFKGLDNFKPFRMRLVETMSYQEINDILQEVSEVYSLETV